MCSQPVIIALFVLAIAKYSVCQDGTKYSVPQPRIEVFSRGFRVSIPDQDGINLFAFHGNINKRMDDLEAGRYSKDILKKENGHWVFEDTNATLYLGDVIYYWLFVIRHNLGFRYDNGKFVVREIKSEYTKFDPTLPSPTNTDAQSNWYFEPLDKPTSVHRHKNRNNSSVLPPPSDSNVGVVSTDRKPVSTCCQLFLNVTNQISILSEHIDRLTEENKILRDLANKDEHYATTIRVFGKYPEEYYPTAKDFAQNLVSEKLKLVGITVLEGKKIPDNGISFKVKTLKEKLDIILAAQAKLEGSNYELSW